MDRSRYCDVVTEVVLGEIYAHQDYDIVFTLGILHNKTPKYRRINDSAVWGRVFNVLQTLCFGNCY
jgi:hypothetical protein